MDEFFKSFGPPQTAGQKQFRASSTESGAAPAVKAPQAKGGVVCPMCDHSHKPGNQCSYMKSVESLFDVYKSGGPGGDERAGHKYSSRTWNPQSGSWEYQYGGGAQPKASSPKEGLFGAHVDNKNSINPSTNTTPGFHEAVSSTLKQLTPDSGSRVAISRVVRELSKNPKFSHMSDRDMKSELLTHHSLGNVRMARADYVQGLSPEQLHEVSQSQITTGNSNFNYLDRDHDPEKVKAERDKQTQLIAQYKENKKKTGKPAIINSDSVSPMRQAAMKRNAEQAADRDRLRAEKAAADKAARKKEAQVGSPAPVNAPTTPVDNRLEEMRARHAGYAAEADKARAALQANALQAPSTPPTGLRDELLNLINAPVKPVKKSVEGLFDLNKSSPTVKIAGVKRAPAGAEKASPSGPVSTGIPGHTGGNPNHGKDGRFTTANAAVTATPAKGEPAVPVQKKGKARPIEAGKKPLKEGKPDAEKAPKAAKQSKAPGDKSKTNVLPAKPIEGWSPEGSAKTSEFTTKVPVDRAKTAKDIVAPGAGAGDNRKTRQDSSPAGDLAGRAKTQQRPAGPPPIPADAPAKTQKQNTVEGLFNEDPSDIDRAARGRMDAAAKELKDYTDVTGNKPAPPASAKGPSTAPQRAQRKVAGKVEGPESSGRLSPKQVEAMSDGVHAKAYQDAVLAGADKATAMRAGTSAVEAFERQHDPKGRSFMEKLTEELGGEEAPAPPGAVGSGGLPATSQGGAMGSLMDQPGRDTVADAVPPDMGSQQSSGMEGLFDDMATDQPGSSPLTGHMGVPQQTSGMDGLFDDMQTNPQEGSQPLSRDQFGPPAPPGGQSPVDDGSDFDAPIPDGGQGGSFAQGTAKQKNPVDHKDKKGGGLPIAQLYGAGQGIGSGVAGSPGGGVAPAASFGVQRVHGLLNPNIDPGRGPALASPGQGAGRAAWTGSTGHTRGAPRK